MHIVHMDYINLAYIATPTFVQDITAIDMVIHGRGCGNAMWNYVLL